MLECYVDLRNIISDRHYIKYMDAKYREQWLKVMRQMLKGDNDFLAGFPDKAALEASIKSTEEKLAILEDAGFKPLKIFKKFEMAGLEDVYRSYYNFLSSESHNDIRALISLATSRS